ncbi:hypothetical protein X801_02868 [Opisthorchis viverrini]|uniref:Dynein light chain n=1 Tax=Opisthorchis viverrini TaxID=6198 RepID=A0A1S8X3D0_OPIVI|nr:hypothetical protein X801_02868 [Opisthorchis viverrini]
MDWPSRTHTHCFVVSFLLDHHAETKKCCLRFHKFAHRLRTSSTTTSNVCACDVFGVQVFFIIEIRYVFHIQTQLAVDQYRDLSSNDMSFQPTQLIRKYAHNYGVTATPKYKCLLANPVAWHPCVCSSFMYPQGHVTEMKKLEQSFERALFASPLESRNIAPIEVIHSQMEEFMQNRVVRMSNQLIPLDDFAPTEVLADASKKLKSSLERAYGSTWQVVIIEGSYWTTHTHSVRRTFHFRHGSKSIVVWQTPIRRRLDRTTS